MIDLDPALGQELFHVAIREPEPQVTDPWDLTGQFSNPNWRVMLSELSERLDDHDDAEVGRVARFSVQAKRSRQEASGSGKPVHVAPVAQVTSRNVPFSTS